MQQTKLSPCCIITIFYYLQRGHTTLHMLTTIISTQYHWSHQMLGMCWPLKTRFRITTSYLQQHILPTRYCTMYIYILSHYCVRLYFQNAKVQQFTKCQSRTTRKKKKQFKNIKWEYSPSSITYRYICIQKRNTGMHDSSLHHNNYKSMRVW